METFSIARTGQAQAAAEALEPVVFSQLVLALDRYFVHRLRIITGEDGHPLNELEMLADSLMNHDGLLTTSTVIRYLPAESALKLQIGEADHAVRQAFERLSAACFTEGRAQVLLLGRLGRSARV